MKNKIIQKIYMNWTAAMCYNCRMVERGVGFVSEAQLLGETCCLDFSRINGGGNYCKCYFQYVLKK